MIIRALIFQILFTFIIVLFIGCGESIEDPDAPSAPVWVEKSDPTDPIAHGIRPYHDGNGIVLEWHPNLEDDISGYKLYKTEADIDNKFILAVDINAFSLSGADTFFVDDSVKFNVNYYYYLKAYDQAGNRSVPSDTIQYAIISKAEPWDPDGDINSQQTLFKWYDFSYSYPNYIVLLEDFDKREVVWISPFIAPNYGAISHSVSFNFDGTSELDTFEIGTRYRWCVKSIAFVDSHTNIDISGSISYWAYFTIQ